LGRSPVAAVFAREWTPLVATLVRDLGDLELAEDMAQEAFVEATRRWSPGALPEAPRAWLLTAARRRAIDWIRREQRYRERLPLLASAVAVPEREESALVDDQLALIFGCCHPALDRDAQISLTLREVCGLSTAQIARAFLVADATMGKRLVRAKGKIRTAGIPFAVPDEGQWHERLGAVLHVVYLIFTEGHAAGDAADLIRGDLCDEARWLAGLLATLIPDESETLGLCALLALIDARRATRLDPDGNLVLLEDQDRGRWNRSLIDEGLDLLARAAGSESPAGPYRLQALIQARHATAPSHEETDWAEIAGLYAALAAVAPGPVVELNRAVAVAMADGPAEGLVLLDALLAEGELADYRYMHAARADLLRRLGSTAEAERAYRRALELGGSEPERRFLRARLVELGAEGD
jgi:RNA polymerase sigma-70 factor (ECF subfamily)